MKKILILILLVVFCASVLIQCTAPAEETVPPDCAESTAPADQFQPWESIPEDQLPAQPGEGPAGLPTPSV